MKIFFINNKHFFLFIIQLIKVSWVQQQHEYVRKKRDYSQDAGIHYGSTFRSSAASSRMQYRDAGIHNIFPDPLFREQWYLVSRVCVLCCCCFIFCVSVRLHMNLFFFCCNNGANK